MALEKFRTKSLPRWSPTGGAGLRSYFIGRCLMELADVYTAWRDRELRPLPIDISYVDDGRYATRPDEQAEASVLIDQLLDRDSDLRRALELQDEGYSLEEIGKRMGTTRAAVRSLLYRGKLRVGKRTLSDEPPERADDHRASTGDAP